MIEHIRELEKMARQLEPDSTARASLREPVIDYTEDFLNTIYDRKAYETDYGNPQAFFESPVSEEGKDVEELLTYLQENVDKPGLNPASGGHLGYIPGGGIYTSSLGDYIADITNTYAGVYFAGPGAVRMENMLTQWMAGLVGYPGTAAGNHASGGSIANLIAIVTARDAFELKAKDYDKCVIYLSEHVHHSVDKAVRIAGLKECVKRYIPLDERYKLIPEKLEEAIEEDKKQGLIPWLVIASAGTTDVGAVDPLEEIGQIANANNLWYHIDGAYGGFFTLVDECKDLLKGMDRSDSIVMDPHKGLFLPYGLGTVLVKDADKLQQAHHYFANYMQDTTERNIEARSPADLSPELTKHFRGLRLWLPLKVHGLAPFRACLEEKLWLTRYFHEKIKALGFETGPEPELSVSTYRYLPPSGDVNAFNEQLVKEVQKDGRAFISSTMLHGNFTLRMTAVAFRTHLEIIDTLLEVLEKGVDKLLNE